METHKKILILGVIVLCSFVVYAVSYRYVGPFVAGIITIIFAILLFLNSRKIINS